MGVNNGLAHALMIRFGTGNGEPTHEQLQKIVDHVSYVRSTRLIREGVARIEESDWREAVFLYCPSAGKFKYGSADNSDLNALLAQGAKGPTAQTKK